MATKSGQQEPEKAEVIEEQLDALDTAIDRVKVLYEQYFLGIQKQAPAFLHTDIERKIRDLTQHQIRNTALRYRFATLQQKFGSYNSYWRRTLRQIENGTYTRNLSKIGRQAARTGAEVPEEILAAMPKRMRDQVKRDREAALAIAQRRDRAAEPPGLLTLAEDTAESGAFGDERTDEAPSPWAAGGAHRIDEGDAGFDIDAFFASITSEGEPGAPEELPHARPQPPRSSPTVPPRSPTVPPPVAVPPRGPTVPPPVAVPSLPRGPTVPPPVPPPRAATVPPPIPAQRAPSSPGPSRPATIAPSQATRPLPVSPGAAAAHAATPVETLAGPFPRLPTSAPASTAPPAARPPSDPDPAKRPSQPRVAVPRQAPPPGMTDADVNALYASYVKAKKSVGEEAGPGAYNTLLKTINAQAPKIMAQYRSRGVDFSVTVKDNQVIIRAKPKL